MKELEKKHKNEDYNNKNIALIGHMGSGKSLIGKLIAKKLNFKHLDSDNLIEKKTSIRIKDIFNNQGESGFRNIEEKIILSLKNQRNLVLSLGGGSILSKKIRNFLKNDFITLFLDIDMKILSERLKNSKKRPLLLNANIEQKIKQLDIVRRKYYSLANITINHHEKPEEIIKVFLNKYNNLLLNEKNN